MRAAREPLTFELLDDLVLAHERSRAPAVRLQPGPSLGALIELLRCCDDYPGALAYLPSPEIDALKRSLEIRKPVHLDGERIGFVPARRVPHQGSDFHWDAFTVAMHKAMLAAGFQSLFSRGLVGAMDEMQNNIHDHSSAVDTGVIAYRVSPDRVEWVVADRGIGILTGLQSGAFPSITDSGEALKIALTDGRSRLGTKGRGFGFRELFKALTARQGALRFRSDDQLLSITGLSPALSRARLQQRAHVSGFSVTVVCSKPGEAHKG